MIKRLIVVFLLFSLLFEGYAQNEQNGYVKTRGRLAENGSLIPGKRLSDVLIKIQNISPITSATDGTFTFILPDGTKYYWVESVTMKGFVMADPDALTLRHNYSSYNPLILVLEDEAQRKADIEAATIKVRNTLKREIRKKEDELDALLASNQITQAKYDSLMNEFYKYRNNNESLVKEMAERFVSIDYDQLDEFNRQIESCIENGELQKADSLIRSKGSWEERIAQVKRQEEINTQREEELRQNIDELEKSKSFAQKEKLEVADDLYRQYTIFTQQPLMQDSAFYCLKLRVDLDTTNASWIFDVAHYADSQNQFYIAEYYYLSALNILHNNADTNNPEDYQFWATILNNLALLYNNTQRYNKSEEMYKKALEINQRLANENPQAFEPYLATTLNNLALLYYDTQRYNDSEEINKKALEIRQRLANENPQAFEPDLAITFDNLATLYGNTQRYNDSEEMYKKALEIYQRLANDNPLAFTPFLAGTLNNLASLYCNTQRYNGSEDMYKKALEIRQRLAEENPQAFEPDLALTLNNLAVLYNNTQRYNESEEMYRKALEIYQRLANDNPLAFTPFLAGTLNNLAKLYANTQRYNDSEEMYKKALEIYKKLAETNPDIYMTDIERIEKILNESNR